MALRAHERWRRRLARANQSAFKPLRAALRRELNRAAEDAAANGWTWRIDLHRARLERLIAEHYALTALRFGALALDMLTRESRAEPSESAAAREERVRAVLRALLEAAVAAFLLDAVVSFMMRDRALVRAVEAAIEGHENFPAQVAAASAVPAVIAAVAAATAFGLGGGGDDPPGAGGSGASGGESFSERVARFVREHAPQRARRIAATSQQAVTEALAESARLGEGPEAAASRVRAALGGAVSLARARTIARTEIGAAQNAAIQFTSDGAARAVARVWVAIDDARTRPAHAEADGQRIGPGELFRVGGEALAHPGDPRGAPGNIINCRCAMLLEPIE